MSKRELKSYKNNIINKLQKQANKVSTSLEKNGSVYKTDLEKLTLLIKLYSEKKHNDDDKSFWALQNIS